MNRYDVVVIGGGPGGMAAAAASSEAGASTVLVEREDRLGGILKQCIHDGFGLFKFDERLTGPEYAYRYQQRVEALPVDIHLSTFLTSLEKTETGEFKLTFVSPEGGLELMAKSVVTATGCRERSGRQVFLHGDRPAGIFTAGQAQGFVNLQGFLPGKQCVILGSGDIGLIMARRLTLEGAKVEGVFEIKSTPSGLTRNIVQCLEDFDIPLHLSTTVKEVHGHRRVEAVTICAVDEAMQEIPGTEQRIPCDTLILSVGLIPENEILDGLAVEMDGAAKGPLVDQHQMTTLEGLFTCGNAHHVNDLVDHVSTSGETAGKASARYAQGQKVPGETIAVNADGGLLYHVPPVIISGGEDPEFYFRSDRIMDKGMITVENSQGNAIFTRKFSFLKPPELESFTLSMDLISEDCKNLTIRLEEV